MRYCPRIIYFHWLIWTYFTLYSVMYFHIGLYLFNLWSQLFLPLYSIFHFIFCPFILKIPFVHTLHKVLMEKCKKCLLLGFLYMLLFKRWSNLFFSFPYNSSWKLLETYFPVNHCSKFNPVSSIVCLHNIMHILYYVCIFPFKQPHEGN